MSRELLQQALDALELVDEQADFSNGVTDTTGTMDEGKVVIGGIVSDAIAALEAALAQPEQEPVAYADALDLAKDGNWDTFICKHSSENHKGTRFKIPLYTAPPRKEWVGLADDVVAMIEKTVLTRKQAIRMIEHHLKELNK
jgi:hypothetical protein